MELFTIEGFKLSLNVPEIVGSKAFKDVISMFEGDEEEAIKYFKYAYFYYSWKSPYREFDEDEKVAKCLEASEVDEKLLKNPLIQRMLLEYKDIVESNRIVRYIKATWEGLDKLKTYCSTVDLMKEIASGPRKGSLVHSVTDMRNTLKQMPELINKAKELRTMLEEEIDNDDKARGNVDKGYDFN